MISVRILLSSELGLIFILLSEYSSSRVFAGTQGRYPEISSDLVYGKILFSSLAL